MLIEVATESEKLEWEFYLCIYLFIIVLFDVLKNKKLNYSGK